MKLRTVLVALTLGALALPAQAAPTSQPVDISDQLNTQCQVKRYVPLYRVCTLDDGYGSFVAETMPAAGTLKVYGTDFTWLPNGLMDKDGLLAPNQVIAVPGAVKGFKALALLATAADAPAGVKGPYAFTITYTDGSKSTVKADVQGWRTQTSKCAVPGVHAQYLATEMTSQGCIDFVPLALDARKSVKSLTLPNARILVQAISFTQTTSKPKTGPVFN